MSDVTRVHGYCLITNPDGMPDMSWGDFYRIPGEPRLVQLTPTGPGSIFVEGEDFFTDVLSAGEHLLERVSDLKVASAQRLSDLIDKENAVAVMVATLRKVREVKERVDAEGC